MDETPTTPEDADAPRTSLRRPSRGPWVALAAILAIAAALAWWRFRPAAERQPAPAPAPTGTAALAAPESHAGPDVGPADQRALLDAISPNPLILKAVGQEDVIRRWAVVTDNVAEGASPRKQLQLLAPGKPFTAETRGGKTVIAAASYARYDAIADAIGSVNAQAVVNAYRQLHGMVERAYRDLGYPQGSLDQVTGRALQRIVAARIPDGDVEVVDQGGVYTYADPKLEQLSPVEKHLLRMGPRNARIVQEKAREIWAALRLSGSGR